MEAARAAQKASADAQAKLKAEISAIGQDRSKLNEQLIDVAGKVRAAETGIGDAEARLRPLDAREQAIRSSLDSRRTEIVEVLAALQRAGRRTPPALLVRPEDALQSLRTAMLLGSVVPDLRTRATSLASDLSELIALRKTIATERDRLAGDRDNLKVDQTRLAALVDERQRQQGAIEKDMEAEGGARDRARQTGRQPAGPDRQNGAGREGRGESGAGRKPEWQVRFGAFQEPKSHLAGDRLCLGQGPVQIPG